MRESRLDAIWAAVYVEVLAAPARAANVTNYNPQGAITDLVAEMLEAPTPGRLALAITTADLAVEKLRKELVTRDREAREGKRRR